MENLSNVESNTIKKSISKEEFISKIQINNDSTQSTINNTTNKILLERYKINYEKSPLIKHTIIDIDIPSLDLKKFTVEFEK